MATGQQAYPVPSNTGSSSSGTLLTPDFPYVATFANAAAWRTAPESGVWEAAPNTPESVADVVTNYAQLGGATLANAGALASADFGTTTADTLTWKTSSAGDATTAPQLYWSIPAALLWAGGSIAVRCQHTSGSGGTNAGGLWFAEDANPTTYYARILGGYIASYQGYAQVVGSGSGFGNFTLSQATQQAGYWQRIVVQQGTTHLQVNTSSSTSCPVTGWNTVRSSGSAQFAANATLRVGVHTTWAAGGGSPATFAFSRLRTDFLGYDLSMGQRPGVGFGFKRTRADTKIPVFAADIGATATYTDAEIAARLARAVNQRPYDTATVRAYIQRGSDYTAPADGAAGWVTYTSGAFSGLSTVGTGSKLSVWLDAAPTNGGQWWSFNPSAFGSVRAV